LGTEFLGDFPFGDGVFRGIPMELKPTNWKNEKRKREAKTKWLLLK
jgi:hypothetical protein